MTLPFRHPHSLAALVQGADRWLGAGLLLATGLLGLGWILPLMSVDQLWLLSTDLSILDATGELWVEGHYFLFAVIAVFSILFPLGKVLLALHLWWRMPLDAPGVTHYLDRVERLGRWSMLDVFVVALTVVAIEVSLVGDVVLYGGLYCFTAAVVLSMLIVQRMLLLARRGQEEQEEQGPPQ